MTDDRKILKRLPNGYGVPWPDELIYQEFLFLKDYRLADYPGKKTGRPTDLSYEAYLEWLEAYLSACHLALTEEQERIKKHIISDPDGMGIMLGWIGGFYQSSAGIHPLYHFPEDFEENPDMDHLKGDYYEDPYGEFLDLLDEGDEKPEKTSFVLESYGWFLALKRDVEEFQRYWPGFIPLEPIHWMAGSDGAYLEHPDYGWRVYLAMLLQTTPEKEKRIQHLDDFFRNTTAPFKNRVFAEL